MIKKITTILLASIFVSSCENIPIEDNVLENKIENTNDSLVFKSESRIFNIDDLSFDESKLSNLSLWKCFHPIFESRGVLLE